jgi:hypothetical protein
MIIKHERLYYKRGIVGNEIYMFTANSTLKNDGKLVMGAGCAKTVRDTYHGIDKMFGDKIGHLSEFNVLFVKHNEQWIGAFQTKINWQESSPMFIVMDSVNKLTRIANERPLWTFHLPCPAINHGGQKVEDILPMLEQLPDNVIIYLDK